MSLRRADPARAGRRYDRGMPVHPVGRTAPRAWDGDPSASARRRRRAARARDPQPARAGARRDRHRGVAARRAGRSGLGMVALAAIGPLALLGVAPVPGADASPFVAAAALADLLTGPDVGPPYVALAFAIVLAVARGAMLWAVASVVVAWVAAHRARRHGRPSLASVPHRPDHARSWPRASASARSSGCAASAPWSSAPRRSSAARRPSSASACASPASCTT